MAVEQVRSMFELFEQIHAFRTARWVDVGVSCNLDRLLENDYYAEQQSEPTM